ARAGVHGCPPRAQTRCQDAGDAGQERRRLDAGGARGKAARVCGDEGPGANTVRDACPAQLARMSPAAVPINHSGTDRPPTSDWEEIVLARSAHGCRRSSTTAIMSRPELSCLTDQATRPCSVVPPS